MSYILDALRKAERQRHVSRVPTLDATHGDLGVGRRPSWPWPWAVSGAVILGAVVAYLAWTPGPPRPVPQAASVAPSSSPAETRPLPPSPAAPPAPPLDRAPESGAPVTQPAPAPAVGPPPVPLEPASSPAPAARVTASAPAPDGARATKPRPVEAAPSPDRPRPVAEARVTPPSGIPAEGAAAAPRPPADPPGAGSSPEIASGRPAHPGSGEGPSRLTLDVLVYSETPAERLVFINGRKYVEGQAVDGETVVEQITADGAVLRRADRRIVLSPKLNPYTRPGSP